VKPDQIVARDVPAIASLDELLVLF